MSVLDILFQKNIINKDDVREVRKQVSTGKTLEDALVYCGVKPEDILVARSEFLNIPVRKVVENSIPFEVLEFIPEDSAIHYHIAPLGLIDGVLEVGLVNPDDMEARDMLNFLVEKKHTPYKIFLITIDDFNRVLEAYKGISNEMSSALADLNSELLRDSNAEDEESINIQKGEGKGGQDGDQNTPLIKEDAPIVKLVSNIIKVAVDGDASDVHIEHMGDKVRVRFRVDGILHTTYTFPPSAHSKLVSLIKVKCGNTGNMRIDEKRKPQDGRFSVPAEGGGTIDLRVSTFPSYYGEKVEMRILDQRKALLSLDKMGMTDVNLKMLRNAIKKPNGLILITGPTGSGKSTTLYSILKEMDREIYNVLSLEDPVEYTIEGVSQSQVRADIGYTFDNGLRTILRQDPDIIMVGEIRDKETAQLAVQAALTGHLVLSTLHTNDAAGVIPRLIDMGVDPYLIAPTLILAVAQRLVGALAPGSGELVPVEGKFKEMIDSSFADLPEQYKKAIPFSDKVYKIKTTPDAPRGIKGRLAVFEMFEMDKEIEKIILTNPSRTEIYKAARSKGMLSYNEDAMIKAFNKLIPLEEVFNSAETSDEEIVQS